MSYCEKCRTRIISGSLCTTCGHVNPVASTGSESGSSTPAPPEATTVSETQIPQRKKQWIIPAIAGAVVVIIGVIAAILLLTKDDRPKSVVVNYTLEVIADQYCEDFYQTGYSDIPYATAEVVDADGTLLGFGTLDGGTDTDTSCVFSTVFEVKSSSDGVYRITAGNANRGYLNYSDSDVSDGVLTISASIG